MEVSELVVQPPSLASLLEGKSNEAMSRRIDEEIKKTDTTESQVNNVTDDGPPHKVDTFA